MTQSIIIVGAGGHGASVAEMVSLLPQYELVGFVDDGAAAPQSIFGKPVLGAVKTLEQWRSKVTHVVVAIGRNAARESLHELLAQWQFEVTTLVHPRAFVSASAVLGAGSVVMAGAQVGVQARLGRGVIVNAGAVVDHHCIIEDFGHLGTNACMAGGSILGRGAWIQAGSALGYGVKVAAGEVLCVGESREKP